MAAPRRCPADAPSAGARVVLGIDPGLTCTGYGVVAAKGSRSALVDYGAVRPPAKLNMFFQLKYIRDALVKVIERHQPSEMAVEDIFVHRNVRSALVLGHARAAAILAGMESGLSPFSYTALQVKKAVAGYGRAEKSQVQRMVQALLALPEPPEPEDAADALAVALTHLAWARFES